MKDCEKMISARRGEQIFQNAIRSGEWTYGQNNGRDPTTPKPGQRLGDCTDYCRNATGGTMGDKWLSDNTKSSTGMFNGDNHPGYTEVDLSAARTGDTVIEGSHGGIVVGVGNDGHIYATANNGHPTNSDGTGYNDGKTGVRDFSKGTYGSTTRVFRPIDP